MKWIHSFRFQLSALYFLTIVVPTIIIIFFMPNYFKNVITENSVAETESIVAAMSRNIQTYLEDLEKLTITPYLNDEVMRTLLKKANNKDPEDLYATLTMNRTLDTSLRSYMKMARTDILGTTMIFNDGTSFVKSIDLSDPVKKYPYEEKTWYQDILKVADGRVVFIGAHPQDYWKGRQNKTVFSVARVIKDPDTSQILAIMMADADTRVLQKIVEDTHFQINSIVALLDEGFKPIYSSAPIQDSLIKQLNANQMIVDENSDKRYIVIKKKMVPSNWNVVVLLPYFEIQSQFHWVYVIGVLFGIGGLLLTLIIFAIQSKRMIRPFQEMMIVLKRVQKGHLDVNVPIRGNDEISQLGVAMNTMIIRLNDLIEREYKTQLGLREAELRSLQAQIQPHFLYNVLNGILGLNRLGHKEAIEIAILSLSRMMRYLLAKKDQTLLKEELEFLKSYCELQKMRLGKRGFSYRIDCVPELETFLIPKLLLQPLVENAVIHGIEPLYRSCELAVSAYTEYDKSLGLVVKLIVADTGGGFAKKKSVTGNHIGLQNVSNRLKLTYPGSEFHVRSEPDEGTVIELIIPLNETSYSEVK